jgi:peptide/nickel transport system substrate-binding protein
MRRLRRAFVNARQGATVPNEFSPLDLARPLTRAQFIRRAALAGAAFPTMGSLISACGGGDESAGGTAPKGTAVNDMLTAGKDVRTPAATGELDSLTWGLLDEPVSIDYTLSYNEVYNSLIINSTEALVRLTPEYTYEPSLAESWDHPDPLTYVFKLREGVKFHDGSTMTADDVAFSLDRNLSPNSFWSEWTTLVKSVKATGPNEVTVNLKEPDALLIEMMCTPVGAVGKAADIEAKGKKYGTPDGLPIGTGAFKFEKWNSGRSIELSRFEDYWDTEHKAKAKTLTFMFIKDLNTMANALLSGEVDGSHNVPLDQLPRFKSSTAGKLYLGRSMRETFVFATEKEGPLRDPKVRTAWLMAVDRPAIAEKIFRGGAAPLRNTINPMDSWAGEEERKLAEAAYRKLPGPAPDLEMAKKLFAEAGSPTEPVELWIRVHKIDQDIGAVLQAAGKAIGLNVTLKSVPQADVLALFFDPDARQKMDAFLNGTYWTAIPDPLELMWELVYTPQPNTVSYNFTMSDPAVDELLLKARGTDDSVERTKLLLQAQDLCKDLTPVLPLATAANSLFMRNGVTGAPASFCQLFYPWARDVGAA